MDRADQILQSIPSKERNVINEILKKPLIPLDGEETVFNALVNEDTRAKTDDFATKLKTMFREEDD